MKTLIWIIFGLAVAAQWAVPLAGIREHEQVIKNGTLVRLKCRGQPLDERCDRALVHEQRIEVEPESAVMAGLELEVTAAASDERQECRDVSVAHRCPV